MHNSPARTAHFTVIASYNLSQPLVHLLSYKSHDEKSVNFHIAFRIVTNKPNIDDGKKKCAKWSEPTNEWGKKKNKFRSSFGSRSKCIRITKMENYTTRNFFNQFDMIQKFLGSSDLCNEWIQFGLPSKATAIHIKWVSVVLAFPKNNKNIQ